MDPDGHQGALAQNVTRQSQEVSRDLTSIVSRSAFSGLSLCQCDSCSPVSLGSYVSFFTTLSCLIVGNFEISLFTFNFFTFYLLFTFCFLLLTLQFDFWQRQPPNPKVTFLVTSIAIDFHLLLMLSSSSSSLLMQVIPSITSSVRAFYFAKKTYTCHSNRATSIFPLPQEEEEEPEPACRETH